MNVLGTENVENVSLMHKSDQQNQTTQTIIYKVILRGSWHDASKRIWMTKDHKFFRVDNENVAYPTDEKDINENNPKITIEAPSFNIISDTCNISEKIVSNAKEPPKKKQRNK